MEKLVLRSGVERSSEARSHGLSTRRQRCWKAARLRQGTDYSRTQRYAGRCKPVPRSICEHPIAVCALNNWQPG